MSVADVKDYFYKMKKARYEMEQNLADFDQALAEGHITEDRLDEVKRQFAVVDLNYQRAAYIMFLLNKRNRKAGMPKKYEEELRKFAELNADEEAVQKENDAANQAVKDEYNKLVGKKED